MRYITKLHLINWHYIEFRTLDLSRGINFLTGETGAGKSTILDALQLVILGDLRGNYFNKAANENSQRKLIEYLKGMTQDNTDEGRKFIRDNTDFNSYIVIEVINTETKENFCLGIVFEVRKDSSDYDHLFFKLKGCLPENGFIKNKKPLSIKDLKEQYGGLIKIHTREEYNEHFLYEYMGKLKRSFFEVFKKSVAFKPPASIEEFIQKFICDDTKIDVEDMVTPIKIYKKIEREAEKVKTQIKSLETIADEYNELEKLREDYKISKFIYDRSELELENIKTTKLREEINDAKKFVERESNRIKEIEVESKNLDENIENLKSRIENSRETILREKINELGNKISEFRVIKKGFAAEVIRFGRWINCVEDLNGIYEDLDVDVERYKREINQMKLYNLQKENFSELNRQLFKLSQVIGDKYKEVVAQLSIYNNDKKNIEVELDRLLRGIVYPKSVEDLKNILEITLSKNHGTNIQVNVLADLIEVRDEQWLDVIEGYMNWQKLYLIVEPQYYQEAVNIYNSLDKSKLYDAGIIDVGKIAENNYKAVKNSLAEEVVTDNEYARVYIDYILGRVVKCEDINNIRSFKTAITKECFLYKSYIARRLNPDLYLKNRCIGSKSRKLMIQKLNEQLEIIDINIKEILEIEHKLKTYLNLKIYSEDEIEVKLIEQEKINRIEILESEKKENEIELSKVNLLYVQELRENLKESLNKKEELRETSQNLIKEIGKREAIVEESGKKVINQELECERIRNGLCENYEDTWTSSIGEMHFKNVVSTLKNYNVIFTTYKEQYEIAYKKKAERFKLITDLRREYCINNSLTWDTHCEDNKKYTEQLKLLAETKLPEYIEKINMQKEKAYTAFKTDLLSRLKDAIDKTEEQVTFINRSLEKMTFGEKKYKFLVRPKNKYIDFYNMLKHDFLGMDLTFNLFEEKYKDQIEFLFYLIVNTTQNLSGSDMEQLRKQIDIYTDYKTYLEFDMEQKIGTDKSDLSKTLTKNSGGETQSPFFIAVIAAFANHYRIYNSKDNNTMRLIIFDEAFSKMDEEHATMSIQLLKRLGFQAIIAAPDDKIPVIGPNVEKIIYVKNENKKKITIAEFEDKEIERLINCEI